MIAVDICKELTQRIEAYAVTDLVNHDIIFVIPFDQYASFYDALYAVLTIDECQRLTQITHDKKRQQFVITRAILRIILGGFLDVSPQCV